MLGWEFYISRRSESTDGKVSKPRTLARWKSGLGGTKWIDDLVGRGLAEDLGGNGYPNQYVVAAGVLAQVLATGIPKHGGAPVIGDDYVMPAGWTEKGSSVDLVAMRSLNPSEELIVEAWDQS